VTLGFLADPQDRPLVVRGQDQRSSERHRMGLDRDRIRVLVIANDVSVVRDATRAIEAYCMYVVAVPDPRAALQTARAQVFDVVLFDTQLFCPQARAQFVSFRAIPNLCMFALTVEADAFERVRWLDAGADECISIPCEPAELLARVRSNVRCAHRVHVREHRTLLVGRLSLSLETMHAEIDGNRLDLTVYEFTLLWVLAQNSGKVLSREELLEFAKGSATYAFDRSIDVQISRLRNKLGDDPRHPRFLKTVRGAGYLLVPDTWDT